MRVPLSWIRQFAPVHGTPAELAEALDDLGLVVEDVIEVGEGLGDVVVARVQEIAAIPGADRIRRVVVDAGAGPVEVVCGAWNFREGDLVPLAPVGAVLPGGFEINRRTMKGVVSNGMLCSAKELELSDDHQGILVLHGDGSGEGVHSETRRPEPGAALMDVLGIERDVVFDLAIEANRPDAASVAGVARDLAARLKVPFVLPDPPDPEPLPGSVPVDQLSSVEVVDGDLCPRFVARVLLDVVVGPSPTWVARRLTLAGMRPLNNVVDASNFVMLELGQPTHPYDLDRLAGGGLRVRAARSGESIVTLDGKERRLAERSVGGADDRRDCLICDAEDTPVGIAGVMGGASTEISDSTTRVLLEAAYFAPMAVARTSKRLALRSEASTRFERGCDPWGIDRAVNRLLEVLDSGGSVTVAPGTIDVRAEVPGRRRLNVRMARVNTVLGTELGGAEASKLLEPIGFEAVESSDGVLAVTVPTFRPDTEREIDVIEEVARHYGYSRIARRRPHAPQVGGLTTYQRQRRFVREVMAGLGALEAWTPSLLAPGDHQRVGWAEGISLSNPLVPDESVLRRTILPGMLHALSGNVARRQGGVRLFEIGHVFPPPAAERVTGALAERVESVVDEREMLAVALAAPGDDAMAASAAWSVLARALELQGVELRAPTPEPPVGSSGSDWAHGSVNVGPAMGAGGLHPTRCALL
ncbi:MAG TPA: phenylalanine--tRNA ligase subunit beta, partial [Acidimicrobiales bacterium]|nr:phenylalanine--tRNA ligase subunit beta [Acidimicrobiales bacterium]